MSVFVEKQTKVQQLITFSRLQTVMLLLPDVYLTAPSNSVNG